MKQQVLSLWKQKSQNDKTYYSGYINLGVNGQVKIVAFPNYNKEKDDNKPSLIGYLSNPVPKNDNENIDPDIMDDEEIPF